MPAILELVALEVDWEFVGSASLPYAGRRQTRDEVADFFAMLARTEDFHVFEPREFIEADGNVTVLGWAKATGFDTQKMSEGEWAQVFTVREGKITRWRGFANTAGPLRVIAQRGSVKFYSSNIHHKEVTMYSATEGKPKP